MKNAATKKKRQDLPAQIAKALRDAILSGELEVGDRLPSEADLADIYDVSRPTVREALKRLAAQSLIRTERGAFGGAFIRRLSYGEARGQHVTTSTLLLSINEIGFEVACEARYALETSCTPLACERRTEEGLSQMRAEIERQNSTGLSDEAFCASDVALHRLLVDAAANPIMSYQLAGAVEAMQPLMNMITYTTRSRARIVDMHTGLTDAVEAREPERANAILADLEIYTLELWRGVMLARPQQAAPSSDGPAVRQRQ